MSGKFIDGPSALWFSTKLIPTMLRFSSFKKKRIPWKRHVSPAHRRVHDTQRGNSSLRYRFDMHRANCSSGCSDGEPGLGRLGVEGASESLDAAFTRKVSAR